MPRRTATPATPAPSAPLPPPPRDLVALAQQDPVWAANLHILRRQWKWANFSQFFYTFGPLLAMPDVFLSDIEDDLARGTNIYLPRIMHRLLYTLSQDRKLNIDNWQTALRRQHLRRDPAANPIGPEPELPSRESSVALSEDDEEETKEDVAEAQSRSADHIMDTDGGQEESGAALVVATNDIDEELRPRTKMKGEEGDAKIPKQESDDQLVESLKEEEVEESKDWLELPMLQKLHSLHLLTEWQFQNPYRLRQLMKDDDDSANWRIEPVGYDAKTNAYWLIGPDRLWIQRVPPKPPRSRTLKRKRPAVTPKKRVKISDPSSDEEVDEEPVTRPKRSRTQSQTKATASQSRSQLQTNGRATRATRASRRTGRSSGLDTDVISAGKGTRAAKVQANKKLDLQAKELAEFQRQTAALARSSPRKSARAPPSPAKRSLGTRLSARLRNVGRVENDDSDDEWQQVPDEWLQEAPSPSRRTRTRTRSRKGKERQESEDDDADGPEDDAKESEPGMEKEQAEEGTREDANQENADGEEQEDEEGGEAGGQDAEEARDDNALLQKAGLESGSVSDLTDLSDQEEPEVEDDEEEGPKARRKGARKVVMGVRKSGRRSRKSNSAKRQDPSAQEAEPEIEEDQGQEPSTPPLPADFVEWEAIAVTLTEWEHVANPFEKATHYLEKALYKMLTHNIIPVVTADLREAEKRRRMEEAVVHRKRSSRIAMKESEKEEARLAAKKAAEEEDKQARSRRQEARRKKEEAERAKREHARDERAREREAREGRARAKAERQEREEAAAARSTATPSVNGTGPSSSLQPSRVVTPNGVRTPDWVLDCEVCRKQGRNMDDGLPMVSCGSCNRWQHIACHDLIDQRAGRPRRDWEKQQFFCIRCRQRALSGVSYGGHGGYSAQQQQYAWQGSRGPIHLQKPGGIDPYAQSDPHYGHRSPIENGLSYPPQQYSSNNSHAAPYAARSYANAGMSLDHYQPDQRGLSSRAAPIAAQGSWSGSSNGYATAPEHLSGRIQSSQFVPQYQHNGGVYASSRVPSAYSNHSSSSSLPHFNGSLDPTGSMSSSRWQSTSNGYHSPNPNAVQEAAQSLAFMHDGNGRYSDSSGWSSSYGQHSPTSSQAHHHSYSHFQAPPTNIDPLTGQPFR